MKKLLLIIYSTVVFSAIQADTDALMMEMEGILESQLRGEEIYHLIDQLQARLDSADDRWDKQLIEAWIDLTIGMELYDTDKKRAKTYFETAVKRSESVSKEKESGLSLYITTMGVMQLCDIKGLLYSTLNGSKLIYLSEKAMQIDPENPRCQYVHALIKENIPVFLGGSKKTAREHYILMTESENRVMQYWGHYWLEQSYIEEDDTKSLYHKNKMNELYPEV